jgi:prolyl-tRNA editing enzyme YbaK/EbsC (Cys-tRNA(Pro) deacylase)
MPPFGPLYHQRVFVDTMLVLEPIIAFHAGTHRNAVRMHVEDFVDLVQPVMARFGEPIAQ